MHRTHLVALGLILLLPAAAAADVLEVPIVGATGSFGPGPQIREGSVVLPMTPVVINSVSLHVVGEVTVGDLDCSGSPEGWGITWSMGLLDPMTGGAWVTAGSAGFVPPQPVSASLIGQAVPFDAVIPFQPFLVPPFDADPSWALLEDGEESVALNGNPSSYYGTCMPGEYATGVATGAWLVIDGQFTVAVSQESWGSLRARFR